MGFKTFKTVTVTFFSWKCVRTVVVVKKNAESSSTVDPRTWDRLVKAQSENVAKSERQDTIAENYVSLWIAISPERDMISIWNKKHFKGESFLLPEASVVSRSNYVLGIERRSKNKFKWVYEKFEMNQFWNNSMNSMN